jgi:DNA-directed RNA polymerase specialized sigma24 family protein
MARTESREEALRAVVASGSKDEFVRELAPHAGGVLARLLPDAASVREALPEAVKALRGARRRYRPTSPVRVWLIGILRERFGGRTPPAGAQASVPAAGSPEDLARRPGLVEAVRGLLGGLEAEQREALELTAVERLGPRAVGQLLDVPAAVAEQRAARGFAALAERLGGVH